MPSGRRGPKQNTVRSMSAPSSKLHPRISEPTFLVNLAISKSLSATVTSLLPPGSSARVLDVGCGRMPYRGFFEGRCSEYVGCDAFPVDDTVVRCPADAMIFDDASFDMVVAFQVLEHTDHPWRVVKECYRVTRPGGRCILTAPFLFPHHPSPHDYFRFSHEGLSAMAIDAGYVVDQIEPQCGSLQTVCMLLAWYNMFPTTWVRKLTRSPELARLYGGISTAPLNVLGLLAGTIPYGKTTDTGNLGFSNFMLVGSRPAEKLR